MAIGIRSCLGNAAMVATCLLLHCFVTGAFCLLGIDLKSSRESFTRVEMESSRRRALAHISSISSVLITSAPSVAADFLNEKGDTEGLAAVTQSELGKSIRYGAVKGAKVIDQVDLRWERFSDSLRDKHKCDPVTNRRLFDNGKRRDGTPIGSPVLGALCDPVPLRPFDVASAQSILVLADTIAMQQFSVSSDTLQSVKREVEVLVKPSFERAQKSSTSENEDVKMRQEFNFKLYVQMRAISQIAEKSSTSKQELRKVFRSFETAWGRSLRQNLAPFANRKDFKTPIPLQLPELEEQGVLNYESGKMLDSLGVLSAALAKLQNGGMIGEWEIFIPDDNDGEVVTLAVDDDITVPTQVLLGEQGKLLSGSVVRALARAVIEDAQISYNLDSYFIDPTTTAQEKYSPTQLLVNLRDLGN
jgi:hypothetical protein